MDVVQIGPGEDYQQAMVLRNAVFIEEQGFPFPDEDQWDRLSCHVLLLEKGTVVGTARVYFEGDNGETAHYGRVCVAKSHRGLGLGQKLLGLLDEIALTHHAKNAVLGAQLYAIPFYETCGFHPTGKRFMDVFSPHAWMQKSFSA